MTRSFVDDVLDSDCIPCMLGGEHSLTAPAFAAVRSIYEDVVLVQIDAHADLRSDYLGDPHSHACVMRRCVEMGAAIHQFGIRSGTRDEWAWMRTNETLHAIEDFPSVIRSIDAPVYLTLDLDVFDPAYMPGTGTAEPGGIDWRIFASMVDAIAQHRPRIVGCDVMELAPGLDPSGSSSVLAAKCVRELVLAIA